MIDLLKGKTKEEALKLIKVFLKMIRREDVSEEELNSLEEAQALKNISNMPAFQICLLE